MLALLVLVTSPTSFPPWPPSPPDPPAPPDPPFPPLATPSLGGGMCASRLEHVLVWLIVCIMCLWKPKNPPHPPKPNPHPPKPPKPPHANRRCSGTVYAIVDRPAAAINATTTVVVRFIFLKTDITFLSLYRMLHSNC